MGKRAILAAVGAAALATFIVVQAAGARVDSNGQSAAATGCQLQSAHGNIKHVIYVQFDNTHFLRDNPNVPSDLEQMPHLLELHDATNGTLLTNDHTVLISHTAGGILSSLTGVYPDRHGQIVSNSNVRLQWTGGVLSSRARSATGPIRSSRNAPTVPNMVTPGRRRTLRRRGCRSPDAGCDVGAVATANTVLENTGTATERRHHEGLRQPGRRSQSRPTHPTAAFGNRRDVRAIPQTDFVGFAVHCAQGSATCANGQTDVLPDEPGGYAGFKGLFGAQEIDPLLTGQPARAGERPRRQPITDPFGQPGFPGFDGMSASISLAYVGRDAGDGRPGDVRVHLRRPRLPRRRRQRQHVAFGPGSPATSPQLKAVRRRLRRVLPAGSRRDGINKSNTLFVFTVDEGDHFVGGTPNPAGLRRRRRRRATATGPGRRDQRQHRHAGQQPVPDARVAVPGRGSAERVHRPR